ncbi:uncharacterized protein RHO25_011228 [Cercospora beticola]|nr:hypothetical protein RHO25_011228 [Cercospora beticola]
MTRTNNARILPSPAESSVTSPSAGSRVVQGSGQGTSSYRPQIWTPDHVHGSTESRRMVQARSVVRAETVPPPDRIQEILSVPSAGILMDSAAGRPVGYLGETSSSAFVAELNQNLGIDTPATLNESHTERLSDDHVEKGLKVLNYFKDISLIEYFAHKWLGKLDSFLMYSPIFRIWFEESIPVIQDALNAKTPITLAAQLSRNTQLSLPCTRTTLVQDWARAATGPNLRWETMGLILTQVGVIASMSPAWEPIFTAGQSRKEMVQTIYDLAGICIELSQRCGSRNELLICLLYERLLITSIMQGDTSSQVWTSFSEVADTAVLHGLHLEVPENANMPFFLRELRSRIFNVIFSMDKLLSTFLGRPPRISYRYSVVQEPHDLTDAEICSDPDTLQRRLSELSLSGGWSTRGPVARATWRKANTSRHIIREEILEIVIGPHITDIESRLQFIRAREQEALAKMPEFCRLDPEQLIADIKRNPTIHIPGRGVPWRPVDVVCFCSIHLGMQHAAFLLERAAYNKTKSDPSMLIATARSLLSLVLKAYSLSDFLNEFQVDLTDSLAFYVVPTAGVLALEMLKREQYYHANDDFPRSEVLQQLSVLVPILEAVPADEGNGPICAMGLHAIKKVLDRLLSRPYQRPATNFDAQTGGGTNQFTTNMDNDADFLQWLGNLDFDTSDWQLS